MKMTKPELELIKFNTLDVITTSGELTKIPLNDQENPVTDDTKKSTSTDFYADPENLWNITQ